MLFERLLRSLEKWKGLLVESTKTVFFQRTGVLWMARGMDPLTVKTLKMLEKVLRDHDLVVIDPLGQPFNPEFHEAMTVLPSADAEENTVIEVLQKGFRLHDRLIRPAMVVVSRKP